MLIVSAGQMSYYAVLSEEVEYCDDRVCLSVCLFIYTHISKTTRSHVTKFAVPVPYGHDKHRCKKNVFYVFYSCHVVTFFNVFFIFPTFSKIKNVENLT